MHMFDAPVRLEQRSLATADAKSVVFDVSAATLAEPADARAIGVSVL